jgi:hypothetical protein
MLNKLSQKPVPEELWSQIEGTLRKKRDERRWQEHLTDLLTIKQPRFALVPIAVLILFVSMSTTMVSIAKTHKEVNSYLAQVMSPEYINADSDYGTFSSI